MVLLIVAMGCNGMVYSGNQSAMLDIGNNFAGTLMGVINALGNTMGFVAPMIVGKIVNGHNDVEHWQVRLLFFIQGVHTQKIYIKSFNFKFRVIFELL